MQGIDADGIEQRAVPQSGKEEFATGAVCLAKATDRAGQLRVIDGRSVNRQAQIVLCTIT
jgi:hypothetical protein